MYDACARVDEWERVTTADFHAKIVRRKRPAILRGVVDSWPLVRMGRDSPRALVEYLDSFNNGELVNTVVAPPQTGGRIFISDDMSGLNFKRSRERMPSVLKALLNQLELDEPWAIAMQAVSASQVLPGLQQENGSDLVPTESDARLWIGNKVTVAPHYDVADNLACVAAGRRRFILFPPEQVSNLYVGPFDLSPAGVPIGMVPLEDPDLERFPRYRDALASAQVAELGPGDAIYIPYMWWHGVQSLDRFNLLVNFWWNEDAVAAEHPYGALLEASYLLYRNMTPEHRQIWRAMYDYYVFATHDEPFDHLPPVQRHSVQSLDPDAIARFKEAVRDLLGGN